MSSTVQKFTCSLPIEQFNKVMKHANEQNMSRSAVIQEALRWYFEKPSPLEYLTEIEGLKSVLIKIETKIDESQGGKDNVK